MEKHDCQQDEQCDLRDQTPDLPAAQQDTADNKTDDHDEAELDDRIGDIFERHEGPIVYAERNEVRGRG